MAAEEYTTKIKVEADLQGASQTEKAFGEIDKKAKSLTQSVSGVTKAVRLMRSALAGFGVLGLFTSLIGAVDGLRKKLSEASGEADRLRRESEKAADAKAVEKLAAAYAKLKESIDKAATAKKQANELEDMQKTSARELEDIEANAAKDEELATLDPNDPYYERKKAQIEAKYGAKSANRAAQRKIEDADTAAARTMADAEAKGGEASMRRAALIDDRAQLDMLKQRRASAVVESLGKNDITGGTQLWTDFTRLFGMNGGWGRLGSYSTAEGDAKRKDAEDRAKRYEAEIKAKEKDIADKEAKIEELENEAVFLSRKGVVQSGMAENARDAAANISISGRRSVSAADAALAGDIAKQEDAARAKQMVEEQLARLDARRTEAQQRMFDAGVSQRNAAGAYNSAMSRGDRRGSAEAAKQLAVADENVATAERELEKYIRSIDKKTKAFTRILEEANRTIDKNNSQRLSAQAEALTTN